MKYSFICIQDYKVCSIRNYYLFNLRRLQESEGIYTAYPGVNGIQSFNISRVEEGEVGQAFSFYLNCFVYCPERFLFISRLSLITLQSFRRSRHGWNTVNGLKIQNFIPFFFLSLFDPIARSISPDSIHWIHVEILYCKSNLFRDTNNMKAAGTGKRPDARKIRRLMLAHFFHAQNTYAVKVNIFVALDVTTTLIHLRRLYRNVENGVVWRCVTNNRDEAVVDRVSRYVGSLLLATYTTSN